MPKEADMAKTKQPYKIWRFNLDGSFDKEFDTVILAGQSVGLSDTTIWGAIETGEEKAGYFWDTAI